MWLHPKVPALLEMTDGIPADRSASRIPLHDGPVHWLGAAVVGHPCVRDVDGYALKVDGGCPRLPRAHYRRGPVPVYALDELRLHLVVHEGAHLNGHLVPVEGLAFQSLAS